MKRKAYCIQWSHREDHWIVIEADSAKDARRIFDAHEVDDHILDEGWSSASGRESRPVIRRAPDFDGKITETRQDAP
jgi:hypothetical protein